MAEIADPSLDAQFVAFDSKNPAVYVAFKNLAEEMYKALVFKGKPVRIGAKAVWERIRWEIGLDTMNTYGDEFKLDNDLVSRYARKLAKEDPRFLVAFQFRKLKTKTFGQLA